MPDTKTPHASDSALHRALSERILLLDGAMGVMIQQLGLPEDEFRGDMPASAQLSLKRNFDILALTRPDIISDIHRRYLEAGADIIETDTFNANALSQQAYGTSHLVREINRAAARIARVQADRFTAADGRRRYVAGAIGPTALSASRYQGGSMSTTHEDIYVNLKNAFRQQAAALTEGGVDLLIIETLFDALNAEAAIAGVREAMSLTGIRLPVILSFTIDCSTGYILTGHDMEAMTTIASKADPLAVGFNCSDGPVDLLPHLRRLSATSPFHTIAYPNAGLPDLSGRYPYTPELFAEATGRMIDERLVNIVGGCCGTTPEHIRALADRIAASDIPPRTPAAGTDAMCAGRH